MTAAYVIEPLDAHDRSDFSCRSGPLDRYLKEQASQDTKRLMANCFVAVERATGVVAGYYTLAATSVPTNSLPSELTRRLPRYPAVPAALIGRLAVDRRYERRGLGGAMLADAATRVLEGDLPAFAVIVEAKDADAVAFYRHHGFERFASRPMALFLPLATITKAAKRPKQP